MIKNKRDFLFYLEADLASRRLKKWKFKHRFKYPELYYQRILRKVEYLTTLRSKWCYRLRLQYEKYRLLKHGMKLGFTIRAHNFGPGLKLAHYGSIVVNSKARIGKNCVVHSAVNIGIEKGKSPVIGDNVYIGPGAKIFGGIKIGNNVIIGANAVVNKDVPDNVTVVGIPARIIAEGAEAKVIKGADIVRKRHRKTRSKMKSDKL